MLPPRGQEDKKDKDGQDAETSKNSKNLEKDKGGPDAETARNVKNLEKDEGGQDAETARTNKNLEKDQGGQDAETARNNKNLEKDKGGQHTEASNNNQNFEDSEAAKIVEQMCFAQFIRMYESRTWQQKRKTNDEGEAEQSDSDGEERLDEGQLAIEDDYNYLITGEEENSRRKIPHLLTLKNPLPGEPTIFQKRTFPRALRFFKNKADKAPHMFFFSQLILYHPFRDENELFPEDPEKCEELYNTHKKEILMRKARIMPYLESVEEAQAMYEERKAKEETNVEDAVGADLDQGIAYRIGLLSNADISDFFVYRIVYRIEHPISSISIFSKPMIFLSFFAENSKNSPKILKIRRKFAENSENSPKILKIRRKFLKKKVFFEALISYRIVSYREKNPHIVSISYRIEKKLIATQ